MSQTIGKTNAGGVRGGFCITSKVLFEIIDKNPDSPPVPTLMAQLIKIPFISDLLSFNIASPQGKMLTL